MQFRVRLLVAALSLAVLAALAAAAVPRGIADLSAFTPREALLLPDPGQPRETAQQQWLRGRDGLLRAVHLDPRNPANYEHLARWYERAALRIARGHPVGAAYLRQALAYARQSLVARPGSPYTWMNLAIIKSHLGEFDEELHRAVVNAARLGPWEPEVQLGAAALALTGRLSPEAHAKALTLMGNALKRYRRELVEQARRSGRWDIFCSVPGAPGAAPERC